ACAAAPPAYLTKEQAEQDRKAFVLFGRAQAEWKAGKRELAVTTMRQTLAGVERVWGRDARVPYLVSGRLASWEQQRGHLAQAATHLERRWRILDALRGKDDWRTIDARWQARTARMQAGWTACQNKQWFKASELNAEVFRLWKQGQPAK